MIVLHSYHVNIPLPEVPLHYTQISEIKLILTQDICLDINNTFLLLMEYTQYEQRNAELCGNCVEKAFTDLTLELLTQPVHLINK